MYIIVQQIFQIIIKFKLLVKETKIYFHRDYTTKMYKKHRIQKIIQICIGMNSNYLTIVFEQFYITNVYLLTFSKIEIKDKIFNIQSVSVYFLIVKNGSNKNLFNFVKKT